MAARTISSGSAYCPPPKRDQYRAVDGFLDAKLQMLAAFESQSHRDYMDPELVRATARYWSRFGGGQYAEPLEMVRAATMLSSKARAIGVAAAPAAEKVDGHGGHA